MKLILFALVMISAGFISCKKSCRTVGVSGVWIKSNDSIPDTGAVVTQYKKGSNFTSALNTFYNTKDRTLGNISARNIVLSFANVGDLLTVYNYDWLVILLPSNKAYRIKNIDHSDDHRSHFGYGEVDPCYNSIHYTVNDVAQTRSVYYTGGNTGYSATTLEVKY